MGCRSGKCVAAVLVAAVVLMLFPIGPATAGDAAKVALVLARTGAAAISDRSGWLAAELAVEDINKTGGFLGHRLELVGIDNQSTPIGAMKAAKHAVREQVLAVIGAGWSSHSLPMAKVLQNAGVPMITPSSTQPEVTRIGDYIFRVCFTDTFQGRALAKFAIKDLEARSAIVLRNVSESYSVYLAELFTETYRDMGGTVLWQGDYKTDTADFTELLKRVIALKPKVVFVPGYERDCGILLRQAGALGIKTCFLGGDGWGIDILRVAGQAADGSYFLTHWHPSVSTTSPSEAVQVFKKRFPEPDYHSLMLPLVYDAFLVLADAVQRAGSLDRDKIRQALADTKDFRGVTGALIFDANGDPVSRSAIILTFDGGRIRFFQAVNYP